MVYIYLRRIGAIKSALFDDFRHVPVMSYSAKFASHLYGPFRDAAHSVPSFGDRKQYQLPYTGDMLPIRAIERDLNEGADMIMVKPAGMYLDIIKQARQMCDVPISAYQVSGEYAMIYRAAEAGCFSLKDGVLESIYSMRRSGADIILTYYTPQLLDWVDEINNEK